MGATPKEFSPVQDLRPGVTLIEASAGTGKTWNIANLFVRLLAEKPVETIAVDRILVVTFTEAATAELRDRIRKRLRAALTALETSLPGGAPLPDDPVFRLLVTDGVRLGDLARRAQRLRDALECFDQATIATIHSFCQRMLRLNAFESGVTFDQELLTDVRALLDEIVTDFWTTHTHDRWPAVLRMLPPSLLATLAGLARAVGETGIPLVPEIDPDEAEPDIGQPAWERDVAAFRTDWKTARDPAIEVLDRSITAKHLYAKVSAQAVAAAADALDDWLDAGGDPATLDLDALGMFTTTVLQSCTRVEDGTQHPVPTHPLFRRCDAFLESHRRLARSVEAWRGWLERRFALYVRREVPRRKEALGVQSYQDLLARLRDRLCTQGEDAARLQAAIQSRFDAALIDEFQDTDPIQWDIFCRLFQHPKGRLHLIGDPKQAIYAFRHADVFAYLRAKKATPAEDRFTLTRNHRSDRPMVEVLNRLFGRLDPLPFGFDEIPYDAVSTPAPDVRLRQGDGSPAPLHVSFVPGRPDGKPHSKEDLENLIPRLVASQIRDLLESGAEVLEDRHGDTPYWRKVEARDIAVLVRKNKQATRIQEALRQAGIPGVLHGADNVLKSDEAADLVLVMAAALEPSRIARLRAALATRLVGATANELAALEGDSRTLDDRLELFHRLSTTWEEHSFSRMFRLLLDRTGAVERLLGAADGERRLTNTLHVAELLGRAESEEDLRPAGLLAWLQRQIASTDVDAEALEQRLETDATAVDIVTMHRCKGLEYRLTWCPYLWDDLAGGGDGAVRFHDAADGDRLKLDIGSAGPDRDAHVAQARFEGRVENLRMLYVALTRARHRCSIVTGHVTCVGSSPLGWFFHRRPAGDAQAMLDATAASVGAMGSDDLLAELQALQGPDLVVERVEAPPIAPLPATATGGGTAASLDARTWQRQDPVDTLWRRVSYSGLLKAEPPSDGTDEDQKERDEAGAGEPPGRTGRRERRSGSPGGEGGTPILFRDLAGGRNTGDCLHDLLEHIDFTQGPDDWRPTVDRVLAQYGFEASLAPAVEGSIRQVLLTPLDTPGGTLRLRDIPRSDRRSELKFDLPVLDGSGGSPPHALVGRQLLSKPFVGMEADPGYHARVAALPFNAFRGFMTGFIDLVFRAGGRWYVVDYKSNFLGETREEYDREAMREAMSEGHYFLQYHLYAVALHRFLSWRLPGYRYDDHFGGVFYLFLRGMPGEGTGDTGVFRDRPSRERITALSNLLG